MSRRAADKPRERPISELMAARGLRPVRELAAGKPCGTRLRYYAGCRCADCRRANTDYENARRAARKRGETNRIVSAERARVHLAWLSAQGVGRKTAADAARLSPTTVSLIVARQRTRLREDTERRILRVTPATAADGAHIDATPTQRLLAELIASGYTHTRLASELHGRATRSLQIGRRCVTVRTAERVRRLHERLRCVRAEPTLELLRELSEEGYHRKRIERAIAEAAAARGWSAPELTLRRGGLIAHRSALLVQALHHTLLHEEDCPC